MTHTCLYEFTERGMAAFKLALTSQLSEDAVRLDDADIAVPVSGTSGFLPEPFETARDMAASVISAFGSRNISELSNMNGLWAWLTFVCRDALFPRNSAGQRKIGEVHRWYPSDPSDYQKAQRHLVRMPVILLHELGEDAAHLLCGPPGILPDIREQLTSQQDMFHPTFQRAARQLYFDNKLGRLRRGSGSKGGGSPRRLAEVRRQFDVTWDLYDLSAERLLGLLPREFNRFRSPAAGTRP
jgi:hypothetical protein